LRSEAGGQTDRFGSIDDDDDDDDDDDEPRVKKSKQQQQQQQQNYHNNAHWLQPPSLARPSNYVAYYDAAALYPSSGKLSFLF
jgi:hypothetical protein